MAKRHIIQASLFCISIVVAGCKSDTPAGNEASHIAATGPSAAAGQADDAALLAMRTSKFVNEMGPLLDKGAASQPSVVKFEDPKSLPPSVITRKDHTSIVANAARQAAYTQKPGDDDVPQILPESADFTSSPPAPKVAPITIATDEYERKLQKQVQDYPKDAAGQLDYELLRFVRGETTPDLATIAGLSPEDREITAALMDGLNNFRNTVRADNNLLLSHKVQPLIEMADRLRSESELTIPAIARCSRVESFGVYKPVAASRFAAGRENQVIVYAEVGNFSSAVNDDKFWETHLKQEMVLYTDTGMPVWPPQSNAQPFVDKARNRRHDFFVARLVKLPANLTIGRYLLKVSITDEQTHRMAEISTPIDIVAGMAPVEAAAPR